MAVFYHILGHNITPIFTLIGVGYLLGKKFEMDLLTLSKLNLYIFMPAFMFVNLYTANLDMGMLKVFGCGMMLIFVNSVLGSIIGKIRGYDVGMTNAFKNSIMFNNVGNIGVSLAVLIFASGPFVVDGKTPYLDIAISTQIVTLLLQSVSANTWGLYNSGRASFEPREMLSKIMTMPSIYVLPAVLILKGIHLDMTSTVIWPALIYLKDGLVPIALLTLGIQLAGTAFDFKNIDVHISVFSRLIIGPILALVLIYIWGFKGVVAQTVLIANSVPTAVNTVLIAIECDNYADFASQVVMVSSIFSALTMTLVIYYAAIIFPA